jgi:lipoate synthase
VKFTICRFCNVKTSRTSPPPDPDEPSNVAQAIASWGLEYIVITSVDMDDLPDKGSGHFAETVHKLKALQPEMLIEALGKRLGYQHQHATDHLSSVKSLLPSYDYFCST